MACLHRIASLIQDEAYHFKQSYANTALLGALCSEEVAYGSAL
jgi:hypothetical protein